MKTNSSQQRPVQHDDALWLELEQKQLILENVRLSPRVAPALQEHIWEIQKRVAELQDHLAKRTAA